MARRSAAISAKAKVLLAAACAAAAVLPSAAEAPYAFRARLECVHERDRRDAAARPAADEFAFRDDAVVSVSDGADEALFAAAEDFADYLGVSMGVRARARCAGAAERSRWGLTPRCGTANTGSTSAPPRSGSRRATRAPRRRRCTISRT